MQSFQTLGKDWILTVDVPAIELVRATCGVDLGARNCSQFELLTGDAVLAARVLWQLVRQQAESAGVSEDAFLKSLSGDAGDVAGEKLLEAVIDFFPKRQRDTLRQMLAQNREVQEAVSEAVLGRIANQQTVEQMKATAIRQAMEALDKAIPT